MWQLVVRRVCTQLRASRSIDASVHVPHTYTRTLHNARTTGDQIVFVASPTRHCAHPGIFGGPL